MAGVSHVVYELTWQRFADRKWQYCRRDRVGSFATAEEAEAVRREIEAKGRRGVNPFGCIGEAPFEQTSLPEFALRDWLVDAGIDPPKAGAGTTAWKQWWAKASKLWTREQRDRAWEALDRVRFADVEVRPASPVVYAVVTEYQFYNDEWDALVESATVAYRTRERAEAEVARLTAERDARRAARRITPDPDHPDEYVEDADDSEPTAYRVVELDAEGLA
jgi:hypothetical protein